VQKLDLPGQPKALLTCLGKFVVNVGVLASEGERRTRIVVLTRSAAWQVRGHLRPRSTVRAAIDVNVSVGNDLCRSFARGARHPLPYPGPSAIRTADVLQRGHRSKSPRGYVVYGASTIAGVTAPDTACTAFTLDPLVGRLRADRTPKHDHAPTVGLYYFGETTPTWPVSRRAYLRFSVEACAK